MRVMPRGGVFSLADDAHNLPSSRAWIAKSDPMVRVVHAHHLTRVAPRRDPRVKCPGACPGPLFAAQARDERERCTSVAAAQAFVTPSYAR